MDSILVGVGCTLLVSPAMFFFYRHIGDASAPPSDPGFLSILLSVWSRNPAVGIATPVVIAMVMQLIGALGGIEGVRPLLLTTPFEAWHGLLTAPHIDGPLVQGVWVSAAWAALSLGAALVLLRRRDITGG